MVSVEIGPLNLVTNPEDKRKIIGDTFIKVSIRWNDKLTVYIIILFGTLMAVIVASKFLCC